MTKVEKLQAHILKNTKNTVIASIYADDTDPARWYVVKRYLNGGHWTVACYCGTTCTVKAKREPKSLLSVLFQDAEVLKERTLGRVFNNNTALGNIVARGGRR